LIPGKIATRSHILRLKCIKFDISWGCTPDSAGGALWASPCVLPRPYSWIFGPSKGREGKGEGKEEGMIGRGNPLDFLPPEKFRSYTTGEGGVSEGGMREGKEEILL